MIFQLLLLVTPAFGMPSNALLDVGNQIVDQLDSLPGFTEEGKNILKNSNLTETIAEALSEAEKNIREMDAELKLLESEELQFEDNYFPAYNEAKSYLRQTRQALRKLADKTVKDVRDLKLLLEDLDETDDTFLLKTAIESMKNLMIDTLKTLEEAVEKYNSALDTFEKLNSSIKTQNRKLEKLLDKTSAEYKEWTTNMRAGVFSSVAVSTIGFILADVFGCLGFCSAGSLVASITGIASAETGIAKYSAKLETWKSITERMLESGGNFDTTLTEAINILTDEIDLINNWTNSAEVVSNNIEKYPQQYLKKYKTIRTIFITGLDDLSNSAQDFLDQPVDILA
jgi:phage shock protein A